MPGQVGGPFAGGIDLFDLFFGLRIQVFPGQQQIGVTHDDAQDIIEIVCHTSCQLAECLHLLQLSKLLFQLGALGDFRPQFLRAGVDHFLQVAQLVAGLLQQAPLLR